MAGKRVFAAKKFAESEAFLHDQKLRIIEVHAENRGKRWI
jgi:hypothetical protein